MERTDANIYDILLEFWEASIHNILYAQKMYPDSLYEKRLRYGVYIYQCRHPDVNTYIRKVLIQTRPLLELGLVQKLVYAVSINHETPPYHQISFDCLLKSGSSVVNDDSSGDTGYSMDVMRDLEEQFRNTLISIMNMPSPSQSISETDVWSLMVLTDNTDDVVNGDYDTSNKRTDVLQSALNSGNWTIQNDLLIENRSSASTNVHMDIAAERGQSEGNEKEAGIGKGKMVLRRFQNEIIGMSVNLINF